MIRFRTAARLLLLISALLAASSCSQVESFLKKPSPPAVKKAPAEERSLLLAKAGRLLESGSHAPALDTFKRARKKYRSDKTVIDAERKAFESIYRDAVASLEVRECSLAGASYYLLNDRLPALGDLAGGLSFSSEDVAGGLDECRRMLALKGLEEYRRGNLGAALTSWESLLGFDPGNEEIRKAVETSKVQLEELKKVEPPFSSEAP